MSKLNFNIVVPSNKRADGKRIFMRLIYKAS